MGDVVHLSSPSLTAGYDREKAKRRNHPYHGEWHDAAGRLLAAVQPRSRAGVYPALAITERYLHIVCIQRKRGTIAKLGTATHVTASIEQQRLAWLRERGDASYEFGFDDASWVTLDAFFAEDIGQYIPNDVFSAVVTSIAG